MPFVTSRAINGKEVERSATPELVTPRHYQTNAIIYFILFLTPRETFHSSFSAFTETSSYLFKASNYLESYLKVRFEPRSEHTPLCYRIHQLMQYREVTVILQGSDNFV